MKTVGIIGFGNMGSCIAERIKSQGFEIWVFDKDKNRTINLSGIRLAENNTDLLNKVDTVILAVKPQDFSNTLDEIKDNVKGRLVISIAAGMTAGYIENILGKVRVIRTMPNMPAKIGEGITCICKGKFSSDDDLIFAKQLFDNLGKTLILSDEEMMDVATAISGSGPGYFFDLVEKEKIDISNKNDIENFTNELAKEAERNGFKHNEAIILAEATTSGSIKLINELNLPAKELERQIISKGGTTEAAINVLRKGGSLKEAVKAALKRAKELSKR